MPPYAGQLVAEDELLPDLRAQRIEAADGGVVRRPRRDDRPAHEPVLDDAMEVAGVPAAYGMSLAYDQSESAPWTRNSESTGRGRSGSPAGPATVAETTMQPKLWPIRWKRARGAADLQARAAARGAPFSPNARARSFIFQNESWRSGERKSPLDGVADAEQLRRRLAPRRPPLCGDDRGGIEALLVGARCRRAAARVEARLREERRVGVEQRPAKARAARLSRRAASRIVRIAARARGVSAMRAAQASTSSAAARAAGRTGRQHGGRTGRSFSSPNGRLGQCRPTISGAKPPGRLLGRGAIGLLRRHRRDPAIVLRDRGGHVALPAVAR